MLALQSWSRLFESSVLIYKWRRKIKSSSQLKLSIVHHFWPVWKGLKSLLGIRISERVSLATREARHFAEIGNNQVQIWINKEERCYKFLLIQLEIAKIRKDSQHFLYSNKKITPYFVTMFSIITTLYVQVGLRTVIAR